MSREVRIYDGNQQLIGELMTASNTDILKYLAKGLVVVDQKTGNVITESEMTNELGMSDGSVVMEA